MSLIALAISFWGGRTPSNLLRLVPSQTDSSIFGSPKTVLKSIKKSIIFQDQFLNRFGRHVGAILPPFLLHFWSQIALGRSSLSKTRIFMKTSKNQRKINIFDPKTPWKSSQNRTKTTPRGDFSALKFALCFLIDFCSVWAPKMPPFGHPFCLQNRSKKHQKPKCPKSRPETTQFRHKTTQDRPKTLQEAPKRVPRSPKSTLRGTEEAPRAPQKASLTMLFN